MQEIPLPPVADLPEALPQAPETVEDDDDGVDDEISEATSDEEEEKDEDFEINVPKPKKKPMMPRAPKLPLAAGRVPSNHSRTNGFHAKEKYSRAASESASAYSDTESETSQSPHPPPEPMKRGRGRPRKYPHRDTTSAWKFLQSLSVLELKDKLKQMKMASTGTKGKLLEKIRAALDIDQETPLAVLPDILTQL